MMTLQRHSQTLRPEKIFIKPTPSVPLDAQVGSIGRGRTRAARRFLAPTVTRAGASYPALGFFFLDVGMIVIHDTEAKQQQLHPAARKQGRSMLGLVPRVSRSRSFHDDSRIQWSR
ncbi:hypothetical protein PAPYR_10904 [Paratrimastix pyriformis]|uniref:Uncharacterized protein n=1 Tax=Paratrimastix pyriformis TaxID=342808 RepID=A0ABQ8U9X0_9EUKA|nr:hypothetical protein PAPYR_10904 [Paratrimastix pyriformis]